MRHLCGEVGHARGEVGHHVPVLPIHAITYSPSSPHAYQIYNPFTYSIIKIVNTIKLIHIHEEGSKDTPSTVNVRYGSYLIRFTHLHKGRKTTFYTKILVLSLH